MEALLELLDPDVVFNAQTSELAGRSGPYRGHEGMREYLLDVARVWEELKLTPQEFRALDGFVLVTGRVSALSPSRTIVGSAGWIWQVRDGRIVAGRVFDSAAKAIQAAEETSAGPAAP